MFILLEPIEMTQGGVGCTRVCAVIPAYNEVEDIGRVLTVLCQCSTLDEIIVVNDASTDGTAEVVRKFPVRLINLQRNLGKGGALQKGLEATEAEVILFLDADLIGLNCSHVEQLLDPVFYHAVDMTVGLFSGGRWRTDWAHVLAPFLSGQRAIRRVVLDDFALFADCRYGVEVALTKHLYKKKAVVRSVVLREITHRTKEEKLGLGRGFLARLRMYWDILRLFSR